MSSMPCHQRSSLSKDELDHLVQVDKTYVPYTDRDTMLTCENSSLSHVSSCERFQQKCSNSCNKAFVAVKNLISRREWYYLIILSVSVATVSVLVDFTFHYGHVWRIHLFNLSQGSITLWIFLMSAFAVLSCLLVQFMNPYVAGSGIPEIKCILLQTHNFPYYLNWKAFLPKTLGLILVLISGLPIGKEGPFVHISCIVAHVIFFYNPSWRQKLTAFFLRLERRRGFLRGIGSTFHVIVKPFKKNTQMYGDIMCAACALGVACTFAAPVGGVLFSIEVTSCYFAVQNYWRGFFCAIIGAIVFRITHSSLRENNDRASVTALMRTNFKVEEHSEAFYVEEFVLFSLLGLFCGVFAALFVKTHQFLRVYFRDFLTCVMKRFCCFCSQDGGLQYNVQDKESWHFFCFHWRSTSLNLTDKFVNIGYALVISLFVAVLTCPSLFKVGVSQLTQHDQINSLFSNYTWLNESFFSQRHNLSLHNWHFADSRRYIPFLLTFCGLKLFLSALCITISIPCGVFVPVFCAGAAFGRAFGEYVKTLIQNNNLTTEIQPFGYALVGASALSGAVTHTVSTSVIIFELTGQIHFILPCVIAVLVANFVIRALGVKSIYDCALEIRGLPILTDVNDVNVKSLSQICADSIMSTECNKLEQLVSNNQKNDPESDEVEVVAYVYERVRQVVLTPHQQVFPVTQHESGLLIGEIEKEKLLLLLRKKFLEALQLLEADVNDAEMDELILLPFHELAARCRKFKDNSNGEIVQEKNYRTKITSSQTEEMIDMSSSFSTESALNMNSCSNNSSSENSNQKFPTTSQHCDGNVLLIALAKKSGLQRWRSMLLRPINWCEVDIQSVAYHVNRKTSLACVHKLFYLLHVTTVYVVESGVLVGIINRRELRQVVSNWGKTT